MKKTYLIYGGAHLFSSMARTKDLAIKTAKTLHEGRFSPFNNEDKKNYPIKVFEVSYGSKFKEILRINYLKEVK